MGRPPPPLVGADCDHSPATPAPAHLLFRSDREPTLPMRLIDPPRSELATLRTPLNAGELAFLNALDAVLPEEWECYIQPHLNGLRPDFVLLNPAVGIAVYEVKDWNLDAMSYKYRQDRDSKRLRLWCSDGQTTFVRERDDPFRKVMQYKEEIFSLYCPSLRDKTDFGIITAGLVFPRARKAALDALLSEVRDEDRCSCYPHLYPIIGAECIAAPTISAILPAARKTSDSRMKPAVADELRHWLVEPEHSQEQRRAPALNAHQKRLSTTRTDSGFRRIKGPAGSGKSLVLAARAAALAKEGKRVLVATYNITLLNYLRDQASRFGLKSKGSDIEWLNFHAWCKRTCVLNGFGHEYRALWTGKGSDDASDTDSRLTSDGALESDLATLAARVVAMPDFQKYDAILVDEGQDYLLPWWNTLRAALAPGGEALLVADLTQDVYGTSSAWTDQAMIDAGFVGGPWVRLAGSYRLPESVLPLMKSFASQYLPAANRDIPDSPEGRLDLTPCEARWIQTSPGRDLPSELFREVRRLLSKDTGRPAVSDITVLVQTNEVGLAVVDLLNKAHIKVVHTFAPKGLSKREEHALSRKLKLSFFKGDARLKVTTTLSYKGWESPVVIVGIESGRSPGNFAESYVAMTRVKSVPTGSILTVVCSECRLSEYGRTWPFYEQRQSTVEQSLSLVLSA
jgi:hypothetical protein